MSPEIEGEWEERVRMYGGRAVIVGVIKGRIERDGRRYRPKTLLINPQAVYSSESHIKLTVTMRLGRGGIIYYKNINSPMRYKS